jgi:hypothetical protein
MHFAGQFPDPTPTSSRPRTDKPKTSMAQAIKNKITGKVGKVLASPYVKYKEAQMRVTDRNTAFLKDYNAKDKTGVPISNVDRAKFQGLKDHYSK